MPLDKAHFTIENVGRLFNKAIALLTVASLSSCITDPKIENDPYGLVDVAEITQNPERYIGQSVLVRNDVIKTIEANSFILDKDRAFSGNPILVIDRLPTPWKFSPEETPEVIITGTVERLVFSKIEPKYGLNLDRNLYRPYQDRPVIIANSSILSPDPEDLTRTPQTYYGKPIAVEGEIEDITNYGVFELDEKQAFGGEDLAVVQLKPRVKLAEEQTAIVYGTLRPFIAVELERDYKLGWDLSIQQQLKAKYSQKPVLVADKIQLLEK